MTDTTQFMLQCYKVWPFLVNQYNHISPRNMKIKSKTKPPKMCDAVKYAAHARETTNRIIKNDGTLTQKDYPIIYAAILQSYMLECSVRLYRRR